LGQILINNQPLTCYSYDLGYHSPRRSSATPPSDALAYQLLS